MTMKSLLGLVAVAASLLPANNLALALVPTGNSRIRTRPSTSSSSSSSSGILMESTLERTPTGGNNLSPFLRDMVDEQRELQMNVGKAMDVLQKDYPYFLRRAPGEEPLPFSFFRRGDKRGVKSFSFLKTHIVMFALSQITPYTTIPSP